MRVHRRPLRGASAADSAIDAALRASIDHAVTAGRDGVEVPAEQVSVELLELAVVSRTNLEVDDCVSHASQTSPTGVKGRPRSRRVSQRPGRYLVGPRL